MKCWLMMQHCDLIAILNDPTWKLLACWPTIMTIGWSRRRAMTPSSTVTSPSLGTRPRPDIHAVVAVTVGLLKPCLVPCQDP
jgi:hypothetical protein